MLSGISQRKKGKYCIISLILRNLQKAKLTETERRMVVVTVSVGGWRKWGDVGKGYKFPVTR